MADATRWRLGSRPQLDVIRAVAVLLVVLQHAGLGPVDALGAVGVTMFFALSGFLITALLLEEHAGVGRISLRTFYLRRAFRLVPPFVVFLACMALVASVSHAPTAPTARDFLGAALYVGNYTSAAHGHDTIILHTWSLAVEEQFYVGWPLVIVVVMAGAKRRLLHLALVAIALCVVAVMARDVLWNGGRGAARVYVGTDTRLDCLLVGALAAMWMHGRIPGKNRPWAAGAALVAATALGFGSARVEFLVVPVLVPLLTTFAILCIVQQPTTHAFGWRQLELIGRRSYGIYLWHFPLVGAAAALPTPYTAPALVIAMVLTAAIVHLSWRCIEEPALAARDKWTPRPTAFPTNSVEGLASSKTSL